MLLRGKVEIHRQWVPSLWTIRRNFTATAVLPGCRPELNLPVKDNICREEDLVFNEPNQLVFQLQTTWTVAIFLAGKIWVGRVVSSSTLFHLSFTHRIFGLSLPFFKTMVQINLYWLDSKEREIATFKGFWPQILWYLRHFKKDFLGYNSSVSWR